jgi:dipeptidyl aminopeptidase/acylaminoacyl peptidase
MIRRILFLTLLLAILLGLLMTAGLVIGRGIDTPVAIALVSPKMRRSTNNENAPDSTVVVFDLARSLRVDQPVPLTNVRHVLFDYSAMDRVFAITYIGDREARRYVAGLYEYNYVSGTVTPIAMAESDRQISIGSNQNYTFSPFTSDGMRKIAFIHPLDRQLYIFDSATHQTTFITNLEIASRNMPNVVSWSPDGSRIAVRDGTVLSVYKTDGTQQLEYEFDTDNFYPRWSEDGQYLSLEPYLYSSDGTERGDAPFNLISATDGSPHPMTQDVIGEMSSYWGCDGQWLTYTAANGSQRDGFLLNMHSGETIRVNNAPALADKSIEGITPLTVTSCGPFLVSLATTTPSNTTITTPQPLLTVYPIYLFDPASKTAEYVGETTIMRTTDDALYYQNKNPDTKIYQIFRRSVDLTHDPGLGKPVLVSEYPEVPAFWVHWSSDMTFGIYAGVTSNSFSSTGVLYALDSRTGQSRALTSDSEFVENQYIDDWSQIRHSEDAQ